MFPIRLLRIPLVALAVTTSVSTLAADEVRFTNGDRLSGTILSETDARVVISNPTLGEVSVPKTDGILVIRDPEPASAGTVAAHPPAPENSPVVVQNTPPERAHRPDKDERKSDHAAKEDPGWTGKFEFGFREQQGRRDSISYDLRASADRKIADHSFNATARLLYGEQDGRINNDRYDTSFRWRRELSERTFTQTLTSYYRDNLKDIHDNLEQNLGAGLRLLKTDNHVVNVGAGLTAQYRAAVAAESGFFALLEMFEDYNYKISERISLAQNAVVQYSPDSQSKFTTVSGPSTTAPGIANYKVKFNTALQGKLSKRVSVNLRYEYEFDNAVTPADARGDQRITSSVAYGF